MGIFQIAGDIMNEKTIKKLEFDKIISRLASLASSPLGKELAENLVPSADIREIQRLLKETDDGVSFLVRKGNPPLSGIRDIRGSIRRVEIGAVLTNGGLLAVADVLRVSRQLKSYAADNTTPEESNVVSGMISDLYINRTIENRIDACIVNEEEIADNASPTLYSIRRKITSLQASIKEKLESMLHSPRYKKYMQESLVTMRDDRYVIPVKQEYRHEVPGLVHDASASGATIFIEPMAVVEINNEIKQLRIKEKAEIERILAELTSMVSEIVEELKNNVSLLAYLDFIFARAKLSVELRCVSPLLNTEGRIVIRRGRHPLLDPKTVVPIDFWIGDKFRTLVITGPNTGGKTVTLKTVGLFVLMAQSGLHIPANEGTEIGVFKNIFADIGDEQSIEQSLSTFSSHMTNIVNILEKADNESLVLLDELGAGTDPTEGAALAIAIIEHLYGLGSITVATTHYSELKIYAIVTEGVENASCEFDVESLRPTYRLLIGIPGKSNAFAISEQLGLNRQILERAREWLSQEDIRFEDVLSSIEQNRLEAEKERLNAEHYRREAEKLKTELENRRLKIEEQRNKLLHEARVEARRIIENARYQIDEVVKKFRELEKQPYSTDIMREADRLRSSFAERANMVEESLAERFEFDKESDGGQPVTLKEGDTVYITSLNQKGTVVSPPNANGEALVQAGILKINIHVSNLRLIDEQLTELKKGTISQISRSKRETIKTEIDVRGHTVDEANLRIDKFLDDAAIANLSEVTIIHGKGTGALRNGIHRFLKTNKHVDSFRIGDFGEGDSGVTIVKLK